MSLGVRGAEGFGSQHVARSADRGRDLKGPADRDRVVLPFVAHQLLAELPSRAVDIQFLLSSVGLGPNDLSQPGCTLSFGKYSRLIHGATRLAKDPLLPLHVGINLNTAAWGDCLIRMLVSADSHAFLALAAQSSPIFSELLQVDLIRDVGGIQLISSLAHGRQDPVVEDFLTLVLFAALTRVGRMIVGPRFSASQVSLARGAMGAEFLQHCRRALSAEVVPARPHNVMTFTGPPVRIPTADPVIRDWIDRRLSGEPISGAQLGSSIESAVRTAFARRPVPPPTLAEVAGSLHLSPRTLRRRLEEGGLRFSDLLDEQRKQAALRLLRSGAHTLNEVAALIGFADHRGLARAVRRWTGGSAKELRGAARTEDL